MKLNKVEEGYEVVVDGCVIGDVFEDMFGGWKPYSVYGSCLASGRKAYRTPGVAASFFE